jgi:VPDSG-CTERM motif/PEP-CTERM motif
MSMHSACNEGMAQPTNNSLWLLGYGGSGGLVNVTMTGQVLNRFGGFSGGALAMDYTDNTLWFYPRSGYAGFQQVSRTGESLSSFALDGHPMYESAEFALHPVPEPASTLVLLSMGLAGLGAVRRRMRK